jgi:DNA polymerase III sliding clamp (beta) subunit (PCNA family)
MKLVTEAKALDEALSWLAKAAPVNNFHPLASTLRLDAHDAALTIRASDVDTTAEATIDASVETEGVVGAPRRLAQIVARMAAEPLEIEMDERLQLRCAKIRASVPILDHTMLPEASLVAESKATFPPGTLTAIGSRLSGFVAGGSVANVALRGIGFRLKAGIASFVASNEVQAIRIRVTDVDGEDMAASLHPSALSLDGALGLTEHAITIDGDGRRLVSSLIAQSYPDTSGIFRDFSDATIAVDRKALIAALATASIADAGVVDLEAEEDALVVSASGQDGGVLAEIEAVTDSNALVALNPAYLSKMLAALDVDEVELGVQREYRPVTISGQAGVDALVMPIRKA